MRAKNHDQRKGQWLINQIRKDFDYTKIQDTDQLNTMVELKLWNMENNEFDKIMDKYNE